METLSHTVLTAMQSTAAKLEALRAIPVSAITKFESESQEEAARFFDTRLYFNTEFDWVTGKVKLAARIFGEEGLFEEILEAQNVTFDETFATLRETKEVDGVMTETSYFARIPFDYRQMLINMGKIQKIQEERTALICGS